MLDYSVIQNAFLNDSPYQWVLFENLIPEKYRFELMRHYPQKNFRECTRETGSDKKYKFLVRPVVDKGEPNYKRQDLSSTWQNLIEELCSPTYKCAMEKLTGLNLKNHLMDIGFFRFSSNHWVSPHTDKKSKTLTHLLYFNDQWDSQWGGHLRILKENKVESVFKEIPSLIHYSVALVRSEQSWHMVTPVSADVDQSRLTLQIEFWKQEFNDSPISKRFE